MFVSLRSVDISSVLQLLCWPLSTQIHCAEDPFHVCFTGASCGRPGIYRATFSGSSKLRSFKSYADQGRAKSDLSEQSPAPQETGARDGSTFSFGKQKRRRGLQSSDRPSLTDRGSSPASSAPAGPPRLPNSSIRLPESNGSSPASYSNTQQEPVAMPPHLAATFARSKDQQRRPILGPRTASSQRPEPTMDSRRSLLDDRRDSQQGASTSAADVSETGEKAEGVLQIGASGARIPLYGR